MKNFDDSIRKQISREELSVPETFRKRIADTLASLPEKSSRKIVPVRTSRLRYVCSAAACILFAFMFVLPNVSAVYAEAAGNIPVIGSLIRVFTLRSYIEEDGKHEINASIPSVDAGNTSSAGKINADIESLTETVIERFRDDIGEGVGSLSIDYETVTNTDDWFTLKLSVSETSGGSFNYARFYHIDRKSDSIVAFSDLFGEEGMVGMAELILGKMKDEMAADQEMIYWVDDITTDAEMILWSDATVDTEVLIDIPDVWEHSTAETVNVHVSAGKIPCVSPNQNFYFRDDGAMVIVYDEYTVAPGFMGCPEIVIPEDEYMPYLIGE